MPRVGGEGTDEIQQGHGEVGLDALLRVLLHLPRLEGELHDADGEGDRGVLEHVHEFRGQRRNHDTQGLRQDHMAVGLRQREAQRQRRVTLAARQAADARANLLGDPCRGEEAQTQCGGDEFLGRHVLLDPQAPFLRQEFRHDEEPEEHLHQERDVAKQLDPGGAQQGDRP
jgi:hypothetical protein